MSVTLVVTAAPVRADATDQLATLQAERQKLEREAAQYRASIDLLKASGTSNDSPAIQSLVRELGMVRRAQIQLDAREAEITQALPKQESTDPTAEEAARIAALLKRHYAAESAAQETPTLAEKPTEQALAEVTLDAGKIKLNGSEGVVAISEMSERLSASGADTLEREIDLVFTVEVRRDGRLVSKSSHNLQALGMSQYVSKVSLDNGEARISVRSDRWNVALDNGGTTDYLVTLYAPGNDEPRLHLIPLDELKAKRGGELPAWLPELGADTPSRS